MTTDVTFRPGVRLGVDVGTVRVGVARSDAHGLRILQEYAVDGPGNMPVPRDDFAEFDYDVATLALPL